MGIEKRELIRGELPRLCREQQKLTIPELCFSSHTRLTSRCEIRSFRFDVAGCAPGPFEGPATVKPPALAEDSYCFGASLTTFPVNLDFEISGMRNTQY